MGKQGYALFGGVIGTYFIILPFGWFLTLKLGFEIDGLRIGMIVGELVLVVFYQYVISYRFDWDVIYLNILKQREKEENNESHL